METQYDILKTELQLTQAQMDKYDHLAMQTKTWAVTLWAASIGWSFQVQRKEIILLGIILIGTFWFFDGINKTFRQRYKARRDEVTGELQKIFRGEKIKSDFVAPNLPKYDLRDAAKNIFVVHIALPYLILALVAAILYIQF